ncbi:MAG: DUF2804 domain-containing protein [Dehalococcoidia bacterium]|nr:DUF2804 domain-containing protein [Dehalococcoidia bacterium]MDD5493328.1 DUF2804 domain-containing protein [Dehalococcoidia bacterium]
MAQYEIVNQAPLLDKEGNLTAIGWARQPLLEPNLENVNIYGLKFLQPLRIKRWQYYGITTPTHFFSFTISHVGYIGSIFAYILNFETGEYHEETLTVPFGAGVVLPRDSTEGDCEYKKGEIHLHFTIENGSRRVLAVNWPRFGGKDLKALVDLELVDGHESVVNVFPFENKRFFYTRKVNCIPASGVVEYGQVYQVTPDSCLGTLDWGLGVWPYRSFWIWGSTSQFLPDGRTIGLNLGGGIGNNPDVNDNAVILNGKVHKIGVVDFKYDTSDFKKPWTMASQDGRLSLKFMPFFERVAKTDLKVLSSEVHQMFGRYNGIVTLDNGEKLEIKDLIGWAEEHHAKW